MQQEKLITPLQYRHLKTMLMADIVDAAICDLAPEVLRNTVLALENNVLRGMDAIHIGSAITLKVDVFVSGDARQCAAAETTGLRVERV